MKTKKKRYKKISMGRYGNKSKKNKYTKMQTLQSAKMQPQPQMPNLKSTG